MAFKTITYTSQDLLADFEDLHFQICRLLDLLQSNQWTDPTPAADWSIMDSVGHLAYFDEIMAIAFDNPESFLAIKSDYEGNQAALMANHLKYFRQISGKMALQIFKSNHLVLKDSFTSRDPDSTVFWFGPDMKTSTAIISRIMEYWAHSQDIYDALEIPREPSKVLRYIAELGVKTFKWSFKINNLEEPKNKLIVKLTNGDEDIIIGDTLATNIIVGTATDFCLLITQRRNIEDLNLTATGDEALTFLDIAQCYAGQIGSRRSPLNS